MSSPFSSADNLDPESGYASPTPTIGQAANDLRTAAGEKAREFAHTAESKAAAMKDRAIESAQHLREAAVEKAAAFKNIAAEKAHYFKENASEQWQGTRVKAKEIHITTEDYIRENPTKCVLGALGAGFLIGLIVRR
jgi:ElaB/YqjD/DUF883 family membrane-anchored ribosome-binding protein